MSPAKMRKQAKHDGRSHGVPRIPVGCRRIRLIGLCGPIGAGKSYLARELVLQMRRLSRQVKMRAGVLSYAAPVKEIASIITGEDAHLPGFKEKNFEFGVGVEHLRSGREILQLIGTEGGRSLLGPDIWVRLLLRRLAKRVKESIQPNENGCFWGFADDVRFPNEIGACDLTIYLEGPDGNNETIPPHASEKHLEDLLDIADIGVLRDPDGSYSIMPGWLPSIPGTQEVQNAIFGDYDTMRKYTYCPTNPEHLAAMVCYACGFAPPPPRGRKSWAPTRVA